MSHISDSAIHVRVDPNNPGQFFACCGLLELADRLWPSVEGWFDRDLFWLRTGSSEASLSKLLAAAHDIRLSKTESAQESEEDSESEVEVAALVIVSPVSLRLDWWNDKSLKTWAGSMDAHKIFLAMCNSIDSQHEDPFNQQQVVRDSAALVPAGTRSKRAGKPKKREPFYFDGRRGASALPIDVGFSADSLKLDTRAFPVVEAMSLIGLQRCRPRRTDARRVFEYCTWLAPLGTAVVAAAVSGLVGEGRRYRFENAFRTDQRKHKAFNPATSVTRS